MTNYPVLTSHTVGCMGLLATRCLVKDPSKRSSAKELLAHPFITSRPTLPVDDDGRPAYVRSLTPWPISVPHP